MKTTAYFDQLYTRPDRAIIQRDWILQVVNHPTHEEIQADGRIRRWGRIADFDGRYLRVILLEDGETVHNAFFDRDFSKRIS